MRIMTGREYVGFIDPWTDEERLTDEEIVRCMDCKHYVEASGYADKELHSCTHWGDWTTSDGFCAWGERRDA